MIQHFSTLYAGHVLEGEGIGFGGTPQETVEYLQELQDTFPGLEPILIGFPMGLSKDQFKGQLTCFAEEVIPAFKTAQVSA